MAGFDVGSIVAKLKLDLGEFQNGMEKAQGLSGKFHNGMDKLGAGVATVAKGLAIGGAAVAGFGALAVKEFADSEDAAAQLNAVIKSTGGVAGVTADQATKLASSLQAVTKFSDEAVLGGENMLLTFTNIGKDIFPQATETMLDMSEALGQDVQSSAIQLGKALQDPIQGVTALRRVGVNFSDSQRDVIKNLVETGRAGEAQAMILKELQTEFGGSAKAAGQTFAGQLIRLKNQFSDLMEVVGGSIVQVISPFIEKLVGFAKDHAPAIERAMQNVSRAIQVAFEIAGQFITKAINVVKAAFEYLKPSLQELADTVMNKLWPALKNLWDQVLQPLAIGLGAVLLVALKGFIEFLNIMANVIAFITPYIIMFADAFMKYVWPALQQLWAVVQTQLLPALRELWNQISPVLIPVLKFLAIAIGVMLIGAILVAVEVLKVIVGAISAVIHVASNLIGAIGSVIGWFVNYYQAAWSYIKAAFDLIAGWIQTGINKFNQIKGAISGALSGVFDAITKPFRDAFDWVSNAIDGVKDKLQSLSPGEVAKKIAGSIPGFASGVQNFAGGLAVVGERGPELVNLPRGSDVIPNDKLGGSNISNNIGTIIISNDVDAENWLQKLTRSDELMSGGLTG